MPVSAGDEFSQLLSPAAFAYALSIDNYIFQIYPVFVSTHQAVLMQTTSF